MNTSENEVFSQEDVAAPAKRFILPTILVCLGFFVGVVLFFPSRQVWPVLLRGAGMSWQGLEQTGMASVRLSDVRYPAKQPMLFISRLDLRLGLWPLLAAQIDAGGNLNLELGWNKSLSLQGEVDPRVLLNLDTVAGGVSVDGTFKFENTDYATVKGEARLAARSLKVKNAVTFFDVTANAAIDSGQFTVRGKVGRPLPADFSAELHMQGTLVAAWPYVFTATQPGGKQALNRQGTIGDLFAQGISGLASP